MTDKFIKSLKRQPWWYNFIKPFMRWRSIVQEKKKLNEYVLKGYFCFHTTVTGRYGYEHVYQHIFAAYKNGHNHRKVKRLSQSELYKDHPYYIFIQAWLEGDYRYDVLLKPIITFSKSGKQVNDK